jgi:hypothetical protein
VLPVFVGQLAGAAFLWVYLATLISLYGIGGRSLTLPPFTLDPGLGLRPFGHIAFTGFVAVALSIGAFLLTTGGDPRTAVGGLGVLFATGLLFFASLYRLHHQLVVAKAERVAWARRLFADALAPVESDPGQSTLETQSPPLLAAAEIERRVHQIAEWPFDDWVLRTVVAILLGATAGVVARAVATGIGI